VTYKSLEVSYCHFLRSSNIPKVAHLNPAGVWKSAVISQRGLWRALAEIEFGAILP